MYRAGLLQRLQADGEATATCFPELEDIALLHRTLGDGVCLRVLLVVCAFGICIDSRLVSAALVEEVEPDRTLVSSQSGLASYEPVVGPLGLTGYGNVACRFGLKVTAVVPVAGYILDELEGIVVLLVVLREVGSCVSRIPGV